MSISEIISERQRDNQLLQVQVDKGKEFADFTERVRDLVLQGVPFSEAFELESANQQLQDLLDRQQELQQQTDKLNQFYNNVSQTIQSGIVNAIQNAIDGSKSLGESLSSILKQIGGMFLNQAIGSIMPKFGAEGGYASGATNAVIGESGPEYLIPENKMRESMARYARGARGSAVIPENGEGGTNSEGEAAASSSLDVRFSVERINSVDYVTASEFQAGMRQAAAQGAQRGQQAALKRLQQSPSTRRRVGI